MKILSLFILSNSALVVCLLWQMLDPVESVTWLKEHPAALMIMCGANYLRVVAYWCFVYQFLKVSWLFPVLLQSLESDSNQVSNVIKIKQSLRCINIMYLVVLMACMGMQGSAGELMAKVLEYAPHLVQVVVLNYSIISINTSLYKLIDSAPVQTF